MALDSHERRRFAALRQGRRPLKDHGTTGGHMPSDANQSPDPSGDGTQPFAGSPSEPKEGQLLGSTQPSSLPVPQARLQPRWARLALIASCLFLFFVWLWLVTPSSQRPDPRNIPEALFAHGSSTAR